jgi:hypothetical protein
VTRVSHKRSHLVVAVRVDSHQKSFSAGLPSAFARTDSSPTKLPVDVSMGTYGGLHESVEAARAVALDGCVVRLLRTVRGLDAV